MINIIGLAVCTLLGLMVMLILNGQYSFDDFHKDAGRIYRINTRTLSTDGGVEPYEPSSIVFCALLKQGYSCTESVVRIKSQLNGAAIYGRECTCKWRGIFSCSRRQRVFINLLFSLTNTP